MEKRKELKILIVEDSPTQAELLKYLLEKHGYHISTAHNGMEALDLIKEQKPMIVISDIIMPEMDGYQLCEHIKKDENLRDIIVILLTILSDPGDVLKGLECGADDFMIKPYLEDTIIRHIEQTIFLKRNTAELKKNDIEIMVVEDSPTQAEALKMLFYGNGYKVIMAENGKVALDLARKHVPDLILSDILMPEMDGYELCSAIKNDKALKEIPVMLLSELSKKEKIDRGYDAGADGYITKPYGDDYLLNKINILLKTSQNKIEEMQEGLEIPYEERRYVIRSNRQQLLNFLISTYDSAIQQNRTLANTQHELRELNNQLKKKFQELRASEERFGALVRTIPDIVYRIDRDGKFVFLNESVRRLGYEPEELIGKHFSEIILPAQVKSIGREHVLPEYAGKSTGDVDAPKLFDERRVGDRMTMGLEVGLVSKDHAVNPSVLESVGKEAVIVEINSSGMYEIGPDKKKNIFIGTVGIIRDITERKRIEEEIRNLNVELEQRVKERTGELEVSERRLFNIINNNNDGIVVVNRQGIVQFVNPAAEVLFDCRKEDFIGKDFGHPVVDGVDEAVEIEINRKDGETRIAQMRTTEIDWGGDNAYVLLLIDITERKHIEKELLKASKLESLGTLAGGIAHDFNNLLMAILTNITLSMKSTDSMDKMLETLSEAERACIRAKSLSQQLLTFSRGGAPVKKTISISILTRDSVNFALRGSSVRCEFVIPDDLWPVEVDEGQMAQVIHNLVINADHAMPEGGVINVCAENITISEKDKISLKEGDYVKTSIKDQGSGIPEDLLSRIFDPYFTTKEKGSGLGLATAYSIIKNHDGLLTVESSLGSGTAFYFYLPASQKEIPKKPPSASLKMEDTEKVSLAGKAKVLLMDDELIIIKATGNMLIDMGYEVVLANNGDKAIELYKSAGESGKPFDVVVLDLTIVGGMGGKDTIKKLLEIDPEVKAIISSGYSNDPMMSEYKRYGFSDVVAKPYEVEDLHQSINRIIKG